MSYYLTAAIKLRPNDHDAARLRVALRRWHHAYAVALDRSRTRQRDLLRCLAPGRNGKLRIDGRNLLGFVRQIINAAPDGLHSSARVSLETAIQGNLASWLGLYAAWVDGGRVGQKPGFPAVAPLGESAARERWTELLDWCY